MTSPNTPRPELGGRTPQHQAENEEISAICFGGLVALCIVSGLAAMVMGLLALIFGWGQ